MTRCRLTLICTCFFLLHPLGLLAAISPEQRSQLPPAAARKINFKEDIQPILEVSCTKCHARGKAKGGFSIDTREKLLEGSESGKSVVPGKSAESHFIELVSGLDEENIMPQKGSRLTPTQVGLLRAWIDQGAPWDPAVSFAKAEPLNLKPRTVALPPGRVSENPIDRLLKPYFQSNSITQAGNVEDRLFIRRAYLDLIGLLPNHMELQTFVSDQRADKRARLVDALLNRNHDYAQHWLSFWNDALRNDYRGTGYIDGGRKQITGWLYSALVTNLPYDRFVARLINPTPESEGFTKGINWRGAINASQTAPMQAAQNISQVFMGVNLKCASCHDSFINDWRLSDAYGLANIYANEPLEMFECDKPTGQQAPVQFLYPELGKIAAPDRTNRLAELETVITSERNGRLARTIVNRLWARMLGRGLVEPTDEMEIPAWHPDLLDWLSEDLVEHRYDLKRTLRLIATSRAYQAPSVASEEKPFVFKGPLVKRLSAEQFRDGVTAITGAGYVEPESTVDLATGASLKSQLDRAQWIWSQSNAVSAAATGRVTFRRDFTLKSLPARAAMIIACDNRFTVLLNGKEVGKGVDYKKPSVIDLVPHLVRGTNQMVVKAVNDPSATGSNPAGLLVYASGTDQNQKQVFELVTDASWKWDAETDGDFANHAFELGGVSMEPWKVESVFKRLAGSLNHRGRIRAALVPADALQVALGRPNREQVITTRPSVATTLQALELTNGDTLTQLVRQGAGRLMQNRNVTTVDLVERAFVQALGRKPLPREQGELVAAVGQPVTTQGLEDMLWGLLMHPEFQMVY